MIIKNAAGEIANFLNFTQFGAGHDQMACGAGAVAHVLFATAPDVPNTKKPADAQKWMWAEYAKRVGPDVPGDTAGWLDGAMRLAYADAGLHWQELPISAASAHADDIARIKRALDAGYPVLVGLPEKSVWDLALGRIPYFWNPTPSNPFSHILIYSGYGTYKGEACLFAEDTANVVGPLQGDNWEQPGPRPYRESSLDNHYGCILCHPDWLIRPPSGDPLTWAAGFNAQIPAPAVAVVWEQPTADDLHVWNLARAGAPLIANWAIPQSWLKARHLHKLELGPALEVEQDVDGHKKQCFTGARADWDGSVVTWYGSGGIVFKG